MLSLTAIWHGEISVEFYDQPTEKLMTNQIAIFNPNQVHKSENITKNALGYYVLYLDIDWCKKIQNAIYKVDNDYNEFIPISLNILDDKVIYGDFINLSKSILEVKSEINHEQDIKEFISKIFIKHTNKISKKNQINQTINSAKEFILNKLDDDITVDDIAKYVGYHPTYLIRLFKKELGLTPHAFIVNQKINRAKTVMNRSMDIKISEVACEVGFYDQSHFSKAYKKVFALNPKVG